MRPVVCSSAALALAAIACALGGSASVGASDSPGPSGLEVLGRVQAHTLPGDRLLAGPVLVGHRAVWVEAGRRLFVRSLDAHGRTRTLLSTSATPGAPKGTVWPFSVRSIAAGDGRVAFVEAVIPCASAPPRLLRCTPGTEGPPVASVTLFAGRLNAIRPVVSVVHPGRHCQGQPVPGSVAVAGGGIVDYETAYFPCRQGLSRLVLRSFSGRLVRVLARALRIETKFVAAGDWAAFVRSSESTQPDLLRIVRISNGQTVLRLRQRCLRIINVVAISRSGRFALMSNAPSSSACQQHDVSTVRVGQVGQSGLQTWATDALFEELPTGSIVLVGRLVAYARPTGPTEKQVVIAAPGAPVIPVAGMKLDGALAFDGRMLASAYHDTVQLAALPRHCPPKRASGAHVRLCYSSGRLPRAARRSLEVGEQRGVIGESGGTKVVQVVAANGLPWAREQ